MGNNIIESKNKFRDTEYKMQCIDGCGILGIQNAMENVYHINYYIDAFYVKNMGFLELLRFLWAIIRGQRYYFFDMHVNKQDLEGIADFLEE